MADKNGQGKSKFDDMTGGTASARETSEGAPAEEQAFVPRVIYTADSKPDLSKIPIPQLRLAQGMTAEVTDRKAQIGQYVLSNFPAFDEVTIVPLSTQSVRVYKPDPKQPPKCSAPTGEYGVGIPGGVCKECSLSGWTGKNPTTGRSNPPVCKEGVAMRAYSLTHRGLVDFQFLGRSVGKGGFIQMQAVAYGYGGFAIKMKSVPVKNEKGAWFEPDLEMLMEIPEAHLDAVAKWFEIVQQSLVDTNEHALAMLTSGAE